MARLVLEELGAPKSNPDLLILIELGGHVHRIIKVKLQFKLLSLIIDD